MKTYGRRKLVVNLREYELNEKVIGETLLEILPIHFQNVDEINYLKGVYRGYQDILFKRKDVRPSINNKVVENIAYHIVEFKKGYVFGDPIQYVQRETSDKAELNLLNDYMLENNKSAKDKDLAEDLYCCGQSYRAVLARQNGSVPFELNNVDPTNAFVAYSSDISETKLFAGHISLGKNSDYSVMIYTRDMIYYYDVAVSTKKKVKTVSNITIDNVKFNSKSNNPLGQIPIFEYALNKSRLGIIELVKDGLDTLNQITSSDLDDIEQFVQSLLLFVNQEVDIATLTALLEVGAIQIMSNDPKLPADVKVLSNKLLHSETKIFYDRVMGNLLTIAGVPRMTDKVSSGDTGQARLLGEGWTMADERAKQDELSFKMAEKEMLRLTLEICKQVNGSGIKKLEMKDIEIKFTRNRSDNMLVKTQALLNMKQAKVAPEVAFSVIGLFADPNEVVKQSQSYYGEDFWEKDEEVIETQEQFEADINPIVNNE